MNYRELTHKELYRVAKEKGVPRYYIYRKHILIEILEKMEEAYGRGKTLSFFILTLEGLLRVIRLGKLRLLS